MPEKHGVVIIEHKNWNTKQIWNRGHLMMTYRYVPKKIHFKSWMVNDANQDLCGGWFMGDMTYLDIQSTILQRVVRGLKPLGVLHRDRKVDAEGIAGEMRRFPWIDTKVVKSHNWEIVVARGGTLEELFDLESLTRDYIENEVIGEVAFLDAVAKYAPRLLIDFAEGWDVEDVPGWVTGLILGYPVENTISLYLMGNMWP